MIGDNVATTGWGGKVEVFLANIPTEIANIQSFEFDGVTADFDEVTNINSPNRTKQWVQTTNDAGSATATVVANQSDPGQLGIAAAQLAGLRLPMRVTYPPPPGYTTGIVRTFNAWVQKNGFANLSTTAASKYSIQFKIDGVVTDTAAVPSA